MATDRRWNGEGLTGEAADLYRWVAFSTFLSIGEQTRMASPVIS